jgi:hypothetical protein
LAAIEAGVSGVSQNIHVHRVPLISPVAVFVTRM